jgi:hypothetical protein
MASIEGGMGGPATFILSPLFLWFCLGAGLEKEFDWPAMIPAFQAKKLIKA